MNWSFFISAFWGCTTIYFYSKARDATDRMNIYRHNASVNSKWADELVKENSKLKAELAACASS